MTPKFWVGKRVFITGHTGFKGSWLSIWLQLMEAELAGFSLEPNTKPSFFDIANISQGMRSTIGNIQDLGLLKKSMKDFQPDIVIHMAAQPLVRYSYLNPIETYSTNVMGTVNLLEAVRSTGSVKAIVNVTSDKCYENLEKNTAYKENDPMGGYDPYSNSKGCAELITSAYRESFFNKNTYGEHGVAIASARSGNVLGGGDWSEDRLVPDFIRSIVKKIPILIRNPNAIRPWQHVLEPLSGYLNLAERLYNHGMPYSGAWNFGSENNNEQSVLWFVKQMVRSWGEGAGYDIVTSEKKPYEATLLKLDCSKSRDKIGWRQKWTTSEAISRACDWHKAQINNEDMRLYSINVIKQYQKI